MIALVHSELLKLRTLRSTLWAALALLAITLLTAGLALGDAGEKNLRTPQELRDTILAVGYAAVFFLAVLGAIAAAGEYRHRTISQRFLASPARHRVLLAKLAAYAVVGIGTAVVVTAISAALGAGRRELEGLHARPRRRRPAHDRGHRPRHRVRGHARRRRRRLTRNPTTAMVAIFGVWIAGKIVGDWIGERGPVPPVLAARERARPRRGHRVGLCRARARRHDRRARRSSPSAGSCRGT